MLADLSLELLVVELAVKLLYLIQLVLLLHSAHYFVIEVEKVVDLADP